MRAIGVTTKERSSSAPDLPALAESGLPAFDVSAWTGLFVPAGAPRAIIDRLNSETRKIANDAEYVALIQSTGTDVASSSPEAFGKFVDEDVARWTEVIQRSDIQRIE
jgi:tripartite-type tricarboxylate transporter receptor subunit TctC